VVTLFGRVNWFFEVSLASMAKGGGGKVRNPYITPEMAARPPHRTHPATATGQWKSALAVRRFFDKPYQ
jgi:hypothetical protein